MALKRPRFLKCSTSKHDYNNFFDFLGDVNTALCIHIASDWWLSYAELYDFQANAKILNPRIRDKQVEDNKGQTCKGRVYERMTLIVH